MTGRKKALTASIIVLLVSALLLLLNSFGLLNGLNSFISKATHPFQKAVYSAFGRLSSSSSDAEKLYEENLNLNKKVIDQQKLEKDILALNDQFAVANPSSTKLLPAKILGFPSFLPNISVPETLIIDKGIEDDIKIGQAVVFKDNLVGKITKVASKKSEVYLITHPDVTFTAKILNSTTEGIVKGLGGGEMVLDNVLLSDNLNEQEVVLTKGDLDMDGKGLPPDLVVGKISKIDKNPSALFQMAGIESLVDFSKLETVFVHVGE